MRSLHPYTNRIRCGFVTFPTSRIKARSVMGIDPSGGRAPWGYALLEKMSANVWRINVLEEDKEFEAKKKIEKLILLRKVKVIAIDAPLGFGSGLKPMRSVDVAVRLLGSKVLPPIWKGMKKLSTEGLIMYLKYGEAGVLVLETHPYSAATFLGLNLNLLRRKFGNHSADALISAIAAAEWVESLDLTICQDDGALVLPLKKFVIEGNKIVILKDLSDGQKGLNLGS